LFCIGFIVFTGQNKYPDDLGHTLSFVPKSGDIPYFTRELNVELRTYPIYFNSPSGIFMLAPNYRIYPHTATQSEVEAYVNPVVPGKIMVGWNSYGPSFYGTGFGLSTNGGNNWSGNYTLPGLAVNSGDPSVVVSSNGTIYMNAIGATTSQQVVTWSTDNGTTWVPYVVASSITSSVADKNHMTIDDKAGSPYYNYLYLAYSDFSGSSARPLKFGRSTNGGTTWDASQLISSTSGWAYQGVNLHTGPSGECYMAWATRSTSSPYQEKYLGFAKSTNGGANFQLVNELAVATNGIRGNLKTSGIRVNSFPWMAVDKSGGLYNGYIYATWAQKQLAPSGNDPDIIFVRSTNGGANWDTPIRVNDDPINNGKDQWFSNICVDQYGGINIVYYDSRNFTNNDSADVYVARSINGGVSFTNIKVSDHKFYPKPISGLAGGYQGDYIGIAASGNKVFPFWADDYSGAYQVWTTTIDLGPSISHTPLINTEQTTGTRAVNCVITPAGSGINPSTAKLYYAKNSTTFSNIALTNSSGNNWTANLPLSGAGTYNYYLTATDSMSRTATAPSGAPANYYSFQAFSDTIPPVITHTPIGPTPKLAWPITVTANLTDNIGIDSGWVKWRKGNVGVTKQFKLNFQSGTTYSAPFNSTNPEVNPGDTIFYRIFAQDAGSNHKRDSTAQYNFLIINQTTITIGTGTTSSNFPYTTYWMDGRTQYLYTAADFGNITASIAQIGFDVITVSSQVMNGFKISMQNTTMTSLTGFVTTGWTTCYNTPYTVPGTGWQMIALSTPFAYTGAAGNNLLVEVCYNNSSYTSYSTVNSSAATGMYWGRYGDLASGDGCATTTWSSSTAPPGRANTRFVVNPVLGTGNNGTEIPKTYSMSQNYPNPFNPITQIKYDIPKQGLVTLKVFDVLGREVAKLVNDVKAPGSYVVDFDASKFASGTYFYRLEAGTFSDVKKMLLIK
jgi:hypothetical protein